MMENLKKLLVKWITVLVLATEHMVIAVPFEFLADCDFGPNINIETNSQTVVMLFDWNVA